MLQVTKVEGVTVRPKAYPTREAAKAAGVQAERLIAFQESLNREGLKEMLAASDEIPGTGLFKGRVYNRTRMGLVRVR